MRAAERERDERNGSDLDSDGEWVEELCLDVLGRVVAPAGVAELSTACASSVGALVRAHDDRVAAALCRDCEEVYCGESFWIHAGARPRNSLERLALAVFRGHAGTSEAARSPGCGAEWWVQVRGGKGGAQLGTGEAIGMHWDKVGGWVDAGRVLRVGLEEVCVRSVCDYGHGCAAERPIRSRGQPPARVAG